MQWNTLTYHMTLPPLFVTGSSGLCQVEVEAMPKHLVHNEIKSKKISYEPQTPLRDTGHRKIHRFIL